MGSFYVNCKGVGRTQHSEPKLKSEKLICEDDWVAMMNACQDSGHKHWRRDHAIIFLGAALGMRRGEIHLYERNHFRDMESACIIHAPTLKKAEKIQYKCACGKQLRVSAESLGKQNTCWNCRTVSTVPPPKKQLRTGVVDKPLDIVEQQTIAYLQDYLAQMRPDQRYLFEGRRGKNMSGGHVNRIFNTYAKMAGVNPRISYHALRHHRGVKIYSQFHDMLMCRDALRHENTKTTEIYADLDPENKARYKKDLEKRAFDPFTRKPKKA